MVLTKQDGTWKVSRFISGVGHLHDEALSEFFVNLDKDDTDGSVPSEEQILIDMGTDGFEIDYTERWDYETPTIVWDGVELVQNGVSLAPSRPIVAAMPGEYTVNILQSDPWWKISVEPVGTERITGSPSRRDTTASCHLTPLTMAQRIIMTPPSTKKQR